MIEKCLALSLILFGTTLAQNASLLINLDSAKWTHDADDPPGSESFVLREDAKTGALELLARYPAGHVFAPHWHSVNERLVLIEGRISLQQGSATKHLEPGGFAYLPAKQVQVMSCVSKARCTFYVHWDGKLDFHSPTQHVK